MLLAAAGTAVVAQLKHDDGFLRLQKQQAQMNDTKSTRDLHTTYKKKEKKKDFRYTTPSIVSDSF